MHGIVRRHGEPTRQVSPVIASASEASAKQSRNGAATRYAARTEFAAPPPHRHCERERSEREAIQKRQGRTVRLPHGIRGTARLDCFGRFAASQ